MGWLDEKDRINPDEWVISGIEGTGTTQDMLMVANKMTKETGFFKSIRDLSFMSSSRGFIEQNNPSQEASYYEYAASNLADVLEIPCAKILVGELFGKTGCISLDIRKGYNSRIVTGKHLPTCGKLLNYKQSQAGAPVFGSPVEMSFQGLLPYLPKTAEYGFVKMMYFDCITDNPSRNSGNYMLALDEQPAITALLPLYDNEFCIQENMWFMGEGSAFYYYGNSNKPFGGFPFEELYENMRRDYPELISSLAAKARSEDFRKAAESLGCYDFIIERVNRFDSGS